MTPTFFVCAQVTGKRVVCQRQNGKAQRWKFWWKDEFEFLGHTEVEKTVIYPK